MKTHKLFLVILAIATACSKSDSPAPALESTKITTTTITTPAALSTSSNSNAQEVAYFIQNVNEITNYTALFSVATSGATKSSTKITASNGRVANAASTTVTYTWTDQTSGNSVGYQVTDDGTSYTWEFFYKYSGSDTWIKYLDANEKKDGSVGYVRVLDIGGSDTSATLLRYDWTKTATLFTLKYTWATDYINLSYDLTTKAGTIDYYINNAEYAKYTWTNDGHGTWQTFDPIGSGTW